MKKLLLVVFTALLGFHVEAQINVPAPSPGAMFSQKFGLTEIKVEYSRPSISGRKVFGELVPFGKIWRLGANESTKFTTSDSITIAGKGLAKGTYVLLAIPDKNEWTIVFNSNIKVSYDNYKPETNVLELKVKPEMTTPAVETFTISTTNLTKNTCNLDFTWENTLIRLPMDNETNSKVLAQIKQKLAGPTQGEYLSIARYYLDNNMELKSALEYADKAITMGEGIGNLRTKALIYAKLGDKKSAIEWAEKSLAKAQKANNQDYIKMNEASIAEWKK